MENKVSVLVAIFSVIVLSVYSQDDNAQTLPLTSHTAFYNMTPYEAESQPLGIRLGESLLPEDIQDIVNKHNELRTGVYPQSSDMEYMTWDNELAYMAQVWAQGCRFQHGNPPNTSPHTNIGQNIWAFTGSRDSPLSAVDATQDWYNEVVDYHYDSNSCNAGKVCGHYTQVVWAKTNKIGCGRVFCPYISSLRNAWFVVCNYGPAGNFQNEKPYHTGKPCQQCASGIGQCYDGLCRLCSDHDETCVCAQKCQCGRLNTRECSCDCADGWWGADCSRPCVDTHQWCNANPGWYDSTTCGWAPYIPPNCPRMCGLCKGGDQSIPCETSGDGGAGDDICNIKFSAFVYIAGKLYAFEGKQVWRFRGDGRLISDRAGDKARKYFKKLPKSPAGAFVLANGNVGFVKGSKIYRYAGKSLVQGYPKTLASLNLPKNFKAAFHRPEQGSSGKTYFMKGEQIWRLDEARQRLDNGYPKRIADVFPGAKNNPTGAFVNDNGVIHFVYGRKYYKVSSDNSVTSKAKTLTAKYRLPEC